MSDSNDLHDASAATVTDPAGQAASTANGDGGGARKRGGGLAGMLLPELQQLAAELGISGTGRMRKSQLIAAIQDRQSGGNGAPAAAAPSREPAPARHDGERHAERGRREPPRGQDGERRPQGDRQESERRPQGDRQESERRPQGDQRQGSGQNQSGGRDDDYGERGGRRRGRFRERNRGRGGRDRFGGDTEPMIAEGSRLRRNGGRGRVRSSCIGRHPSS